MAPKLIPDFNYFMQYLARDDATQEELSILSHSRMSEAIFFIPNTYVALSSSYTVQCIGQLMLSIIDDQQQLLLLHPI